jgi:integrase
VPSPINIPNSQSFIYWILENVIGFHTLRHWKATILYHKIKDTLFVKEYLGHNKVETTLLYIQLAETIFKESTIDFNVKIASKPEEIKASLKVDFKFVC